MKASCGVKCPRVFQFRVERVPFDVFHHHVNHAVAGGPQIVNRDGIGMAKAARGLAFATKAPQPFRIATHFRREDFYRDAVAQQDVTRAETRRPCRLCPALIRFDTGRQELCQRSTRIVFQNFAVDGTETDCVLVFGFADGAVFHRLTSLQRTIGERRIDGT